MIERLVLKDFKSHIYSEIEFTPGLTIFLGEVGAGKTSIFEAVSFALFGKYAGSASQSGLIRRGADKAQVSVVFSCSSGRYRVDRTLYSEKTQESKMYISNNGEWKLAVEGAAAIAKSVEDLLDVDTSTFLAAMYASQGEIKEMLEAQPGKRRERLDKLLGIDAYENIWKTLGDSKTIILTDLTQAQTKASGVEELERQLKNFDLRIEGNKRELRSLKASIKEADKKLKPAEERLKELEDLKQESITIKTQIKGNQSETEKSTNALRSLQDRLDKSKEADDTFNRNKDFIKLEEKLKEEKRQVETILQQSESLELLLQRDESDLKQALNGRDRIVTQLKALEPLKKELDSLKTVKEALPGLRKEKTALEEGLDKLKSKLTKTSAEIENLRNKVDRVTELGECPTCFQIVPDEHKNRIRKETGETISSLFAGQSVLEEARCKISTDLEGIETKIEEAEKADRKYLETSTKLAMSIDLSGELKEKESLIEASKKRIDEKKLQIEAIKETSETLIEIEGKLIEVATKASLAREAEKLLSARKTVEELRLQEERNMKVLRDQLHKLKLTKIELERKYSPEEHEEKERTVTALRESRAKAADGVNRLEKSIGEDILQVTNTKEILEGKIESRKKVESLKFENDIIEKLRQSLRDVIQPTIRKNSVQKVSEAFLDFYRELSNDGIDYATIDEEGNIDITRNGEPSPVNTLSGGETTCAALALRLAICSGLTRNQLLLLDEPTIHLDEAYCAKLRDFLANHTFEQLIVVTHDSTFDTLPAKIFRVEKANGRSAISTLQNGGA
ncbi:MAG: family ATPase [Thermoproteota archaeon]|nr:family ATPase [Thermoproteota archaeon]